MNNLGLESVQSEADVARLNTESIEPSHLPSSLYMAIVNAAEVAPDEVAIKYILDGNCLHPKQIPRRKKWLHSGLKFLKGSDVANPYREVTYQGLAQQVTQVANGLRKLGVRSSDVTSLVLPNFPETYFALWGAATAGIVNPINPLLEPGIIKEIMMASKAKVIIALGPVPGSDIWSKICDIKDEIPNLTMVVSVFGESIPSSSKNSVPVISLKDLMASQSTDTLTFEPPKQQDICAYFHTGGTTGLPKLAKHTHLNQLTNAAQINLISPIEAGDTILVGLPVFHVNAAVATGIAPIMNRSTILVASPAGYRGKNIIANLHLLINNYNVGLMMAVPTVYASVVSELEKNKQARVNIQSLKLAISGAAPLSSALKKQFILTSGVDLIEGYGLTESSSVCTLMPINSINETESVGLAIPGMKIKILPKYQDDASSIECATGTVGEIVIAGNNVFSGYIEPRHNKSLTVTIQGEEYVRTGDLGSIDQNGYLSLCGRQKEIIIRGGHNIDPKMIEDIAAEHPLVDLAAAVPKPDAYAGEIPVLYVTVKAQTDKALLPRDLVEFITANIPERAANPKKVVVIDEMPLTAVGKIFKPALVCEQISEVITDSLSKVLSGINWTVVTNITKQQGIVATIQLPSAANSELIKEVEQKLTPFTFQYQIETQK